MLGGPECSGLAPSRKVPRYRGCWPLTSHLLGHDWTKIPSTQFDWSSSLRHGGSRVEQSFHDLMMIGEGESQRDKRIMIDLMG